MTVLPANVPPSGPAAPPSGPTPYRFIETARAIENEVGQVIIGQPEVVRGVLTCLFAGGHALLEGIPGLGKTLLVRTIGEALDLSFSRVQFTPDLMPADITGTSVFDPRQQLMAAAPSSFSPVRSLPTSCWPTRSIALRPRPSRRCSKPCRSGG